jgi:hypothetical protein
MHHPSSFLALALALAIIHHHFTLLFHFTLLLFENPHSSFMHPLSLLAFFLSSSSSFFVDRATVVVRYYIYI